MALGKVRPACVAQGVCGSNGRGSGWHGDGGDAGVVRGCLIFRLRFQFGIRTLLVLVIVVALPCSWLAVAGLE